MLALQGGLGTGSRRKPQRLLAEIAPDRRPRRADRLAQGLRREMAVALLDRHGIGVDDEIVRLVLSGARERAGGRLRVAHDRRAIEILAPAPVAAQKDDDAVREAVGGDDIGHVALALAKWARDTPASIGS